MQFKQEQKTLLSNHSKLIEYSRLLIKHLSKKRVSMLNRKNQTIICVLLSIFIWGFSTPIYAETSFLNDCIDENPDCIKELDTYPENDQEIKQDENSMTAFKSDSLGFSLFRMILSLLLILGLIYLVLRFLNKRNKMFDQVRSLENLGGISVGQNKTVQLVRVGSKVYMIGVGENVEMLQEITDEEVIDDLLQTNESTGNEGISNLIKPIFPKKAKSEEYKDYENFTNLFQQELEKLKQTRQQIKVSYSQKDDKNE